MLEDILKSNYDGWGLSEISDVQQNSKQSFYWLISRPSVLDDTLKSNYDENQSLSELSDVQQNSKESFYWSIRRPSVPNYFLPRLNLPCFLF